MEQRSLGLAAQEVPAEGFLGEAVAAAEEGFDAGGEGAEPVEFAGEEVVRRRAGLGAAVVEEVLVGPEVGANGEGGEELGLEGNARAGEIEVPEVEDGAFAAEFAKDFRKVADAVAEAVAAAVDEGGVARAGGIPAAEGIPGGGIFENDDRAAGELAALPGEGFGDEVEAEELRGEAVGTEEGGEEQGIKAFLVAEDFEGAFFDGNGIAGRGLEEKVVEGLKIREGDAGAGIAQELERGRPGIGGEVGARFGGLREFFGKDLAEARFRGKRDGNAIDLIGAEANGFELDEPGVLEGAGVAIGLAAEVRAGEAGILKEGFPIAGEGAGAGFGVSAGGAPSEEELAENRQAAKRMVRSSHSTASRTCAGERRMGMLSMRAT